MQGIKVIMRKTVSSRVFWIFFAGLAFYWVTAILLPSVISGQFEQLFYGLALGVAVTIIGTWTPSIIKIIREDDVSPGALLVISVYLLWWVLLMWRAFGALNLYLERPVWLVESAFPGFLAYSVMVVGILQIVSSGRADGAAPLQYWYHLIAAGMIGGIFIGLAISRFIFS